MAVKPNHHQPNPAARRTDHPARPRVRRGSAVDGQPCAGLGGALGSTAAFRAAEREARRDIAAPRGSRVRPLTARGFSALSPRVSSRAVVWRFWRCERPARAVAALPERHIRRAPTFLRIRRTGAFGRRTTLRGGGVCPRSRPRRPPRPQPALAGTRRPPGGRGGLAAGRRRRLCTVCGDRRRASVAPSAAPRAVTPRRPAASCRRNPRPRRRNGRPRRGRPCLMRVRVRRRPRTPGRV